MKSVARLLILVLVLALSACGDDGGESASTTAGPTTSAAPTSIAPPEPADPPQVPIADRLEHRFDLPGGPDWLAESGGSVWVKMDDGRVLRIDPATNEIVAEVEVSSDLCQGLGANEEAVWTCDGRDLVRIDPGTNEVVATVAADKIAEQGQIPVASDAAWVLTGDGSVLAGVRRHTNAVAVEIDLGTRCTELTAVDENGLWASCLGDDTAIRIDLDAEEVSHRVSGLSGARTLTAAEGDVWVSFDEGLVRIDADTGEVLGVVDASTGLDGGLAATPNALWARTGGFLRHVDPGTLDVVEDVAAPEESGGSVLVAFGSLWATAYDDAVLYRLSCGSGACD
jgi:hypothetical protein